MDRASGGRRLARLTSLVMWQSSNPSIAQFDAGGLLRVSGAGQTELSLVHNGYTPVRVAFVVAGGQPAVR